MSDTLVRAFARYLDQERERTGLSPATFARSLRLDPSTYRRLAAGVGNVRLSTLERIAAGLGCTVSELVRRIEP